MGVSFAEWSSHPGNMHNLTFSRISYDAPIPRLDAVNHLFGTQGRAGRPGRPFGENAVFWAWHKAFPLLHKWRFVNDAVGFVHNRLKRYEKKENLYRHLNG